VRPLTWLPLRPGALLERCLHVLAILVCGASVALCFGAGWSRAPAAMDLYGYYEPSRVFLDGGDPYDRAVFTRAVRRTRHETQTGGDGYACPLLPSALATLAPLALFSYERAARVMWLVNFAALVFSLWAMIELWTDQWSFSERVLVAALLAQSRLIQSIAYRGQPSLFILAAVLAALLASRRGAPAVAGAALVLALGKFPLALPLVAFWVWNREWRPLAWAAAIGSVCSIPALLVIPPATLLPGWVDSLAFLEAYNDKDPIPFHLTNWSAIYVRLLGHGSPLVSALSAGLFVAGAAAVGWSARDAAGDRARSWKFGALTAFAMVTVYHRVYDAVVLFPLVFLTWSAIRNAGHVAPRESPRPIGRERRPVAAACLAGALVLLFFVLSPQSVALAVSSWMLRHGAADFFSPLNAWLATLVLLFTVLAARGATRPVQPFTAASP
jgi:hypothetical protein